MAGNPSDIQAIQVTSNKFKDRTINMEIPEIDTFSI